MAWIGDRIAEKTGVKIMDWEVGSSGYAAVWAEENTRKSIWDAFYRKETYATTGTRMIVRFFGGWDFTENDAYNRLPAQTGYTKGVPMGRDLPPNSFWSLAGIGNAQLMMTSVAIASDWPSWNRRSRL